MSFRALSAITYTRRFSKSPLTVYSLAQFLEKVQCRVIEDCVHRIETKRIDVIIGNPFDRIGDEEMPDLIAVRIVEVERRIPMAFCIDR